MPDTPAPESARARWQKRIQGAAAPEEASDDVYALLRKIVGDNIKRGVGMRREGKDTIKINTLEIGGAAFDALGLSGWQLACRINQYAPTESHRPLAVVSDVDSTVINVVMEEDRANTLLDRVGDHNPQSPTLHGFLTALALEKHKLDGRATNVQTIRDFTGRGR